MGTNFYRIPSVKDMEVKKNLLLTRIRQINVTAESIFKRFSIDKEELFDFIKSGRIINEYGEEIDPNEFIEMALDWCKDDGWDTQTYYEENPSSKVSWLDSYRYHDIYIDDLRISSSTDFS